MARRRSQFKPEAKSLSADVEANWGEVLADFKNWEGKISHMFLDTKGLVTVGVGKTLQDVAAAQELDFVRRADGGGASSAEIAADFNAVSTQAAGKLAATYKKYTKLDLPDETIGDLLKTVVEEFEADLEQSFAGYDTYPLPAKRALLDMIYNLGLDGLLKFKKMKASVEAGDWTTAATQCHRNGPSETRNNWTRDLFLAAAIEAEQRTKASPQSSALDADITSSQVEQPTSDSPHGATLDGDRKTGQVEQRKDQFPRWSKLDGDLQTAFAWASAIRTATSPPSAEKVGIREFFAGLLRTMESVTVFWDAVSSSSSELAADTNEPPWAAFDRKLGVADLVSPSSLPLSDFPPHTEALAGVLNKARLLIARLDKNSAYEATAEGVFFGLWQPDVMNGPAAIDPLLSELGLDSEAFLRRIMDSAQDETRKAFVLELLVLRGYVRPWDRAQMDSDRVRGEIPPDMDLLDARKPALRFAKLFASKDVSPPIALGLFGNWGSGKTFFMGLMQDRISNLEGSGSAYVKRVVQIEFNAWHYHDTNLWASLAMRIFEGLAIKLVGAKGSAADVKRKELHQKLSSSKAREEEATRRRDDALDRKAKKAQELATKQNERKELENRSILLRLEAAWTVLAKDPMFAELRTAAQGLEQHFGITAAIKTSEDLKRLKRDIDETSRHAFGLFTAIGVRFHGVESGATTIGWLLLVGASALALGSGFEKVAGFLQVKLPQFSATVLEVATLISTAVAWCGRRVTEIRSTVDQIAKVNTALAAAEKNALPTPDLQNLQKEIAELDKQIHQSGQELAAAESDIAVAIAEIDRINHGGLVYDFLQERNSSEIYLGHLGLISTIRKDLEQLGDLLKDFATNGVDPIERIVLYIDDLDRCHPDKVVEVLQAVHLLLAFDLFNVVVGVDARWLERSLHRQYVGSGTPTAHEDSFSPQDYLEKIFQIPYALARLDEGGFKRLIGGLIETRSDQAKKVRDDNEVAAKAAADNAAGEAALLAKQSGQKPEIALASKAEGDASSLGEGIKDHSISRNRIEAPIASDDTKPVVTAAEPAMVFEDHEESFIKLLYEFIDRPRLAKRFVNIYRLLRVRADDEGETVKFAALPTSEEYAAALILLAIQVGHPSVAAKLVDALSFVSVEGTWPELLIALAEGRMQDIQTTPQERNEISIVAAKVTKIGSRVPRKIDAYRRWAPRVSCYSFDWHRPRLVATLASAV